MYKCNNQGVKNPTKRDLFQKYLSIEVEYVIEVTRSLTCRFVDYKRNDSLTQSHLVVKMRTTTSSNRPTEMRIVLPHAYSMNIFIGEAVEQQI